MPKVSPFLQIAGVAFIIAATLLIYPHTVIQSQKNQNTDNVQGTHTVKVTASPTPTIFLSQAPAYISAVNQSITAIPTITPESTSQPSTTSSTNTITAQQSTPTTAPTSEQPTQTPTQQVSLQIVDPDGTSNFSINLPIGKNLCDTLTEAKNEGKIQSVTLDDSYMSSFHSAYVREINGFQNNWTFTVNGKTPQGCSLYTPSAGDTIVWKFN